MAQDLLEKVLGKPAVSNDDKNKKEAKENSSSNGVQEQPEAFAYEVLETYKGKELEYKEYEPLFECAKEAADKQNKKGFFITCDTYVTMTDGTGIVHIAPAFGEDDANVCRKYDMPFVQLVDEKGNIVPAEAEIINGSARVKVWNDSVPHPVEVRYCFRNWPEGNVTDLRGLPLLPFRSDDW